MSVHDLPYPRFHLDFETIGPAVPIWPDTRPYQSLPIQWSCHIERSRSLVEHREFLDLSGDPPMRAREIFKTVWILWGEQAFEVWRNGELSERVYGEPERIQYE